MEHLLSVLRSDMETARPLRGHLKGLAHVQKLPELTNTVREIRQRLVQLEAERKR